MLSIEPRRLFESHEELGAIRIWSGVGHGKESFNGMVQFEVLVREFLPIDGVSTSSIEVSVVSALSHEARDDSVEDRANVPLFNAIGGLLVVVDTEFEEIIGSLGYSVTEESDSNVVLGLSVYSNCHEHFLGGSVD